MHIFLMFMIGLLGVVAHVLSKVLLEGDQSVAALGIYWRAKGLSVILAVIIFAGLFAAWQWSNALEFLGWKEGQVNGSIFLVGYFSQSIIGHIQKTAPYSTPN